MDRRTIWAILLMMTIAIVPAIFLKKPPASGAAGQQGSGADTSALPSRATPADSMTIARDSIRAPQPQDSAQKNVTAPRPRGPAAPPEHIVHVTSPLYTYGISTRGGRLVEATLPRYRSMAPVGRGSPAQI